MSRQLCREQELLLRSGVQACRDLSNARLFSLPPEELQLSPTEAAAMRLSKLYWKTPMLETPQAAARRAKHSLKRCLPNLGRLAKSWEKHIHGWLRSKLQGRGLDLTHHFSYVNKLVVPPGCVAVQEDKDKAACWIMPLTVYQKLFALMVNQDNQHWAPCQGLVCDIVEHYRVEHEARLPRQLKAYSQPHRWRKWQLAYM